jgi:hypothetical protein
MNSRFEPRSAQRGVIDGGQTTDRIDHSPNFFHFNNQQSSLDNRQSDLKKRGPVAYALMAGLVPPSGPNTKQPEQV